MKQELIACIEYTALVLELSKKQRQPTKEEHNTILKFPGFGQISGILAMRGNESSIIASEQQYIPLLNQITDNINSFLTLQFDSTTEVLSKSRELNLSNLTSYYTPGAVTEPLAAYLMQKVANVHSQNKGAIINILEPSAGNGRMIYSLDRHKGMLNTRYDAFEPNAVSAASIFTRDTKIFNAGFEHIDSFKPTQLYDLILTNCPFGDIKVYDQQYNEMGGSLQQRSQKLIHNYFMVKCTDRLAPGGIMAIINTTNFNNTESNKEFRQYICEQTNLVANVLLPTNLFEDQNTKIQTSLLIFQKPVTEKRILSEQELKFVEGNIALTQQQLNFFDNIGTTSNRFGGNSPYYEKFDIAKTIKADLVPMINASSTENFITIPRLEKKQPTVASNNQLDLFSMATSAVMDKITPKVSELATSIPFKQNFLLPHHKQGVIISYPGYFKGNPFRLQTSGVDNYSFVAERIPDIEGGKKLDLHRIGAMAIVWDKFSQLSELELQTQTPQESIRLALNNAYDEFVFTYGTLNENKDTAAFFPDTNKILSYEILEDKEWKKSDIFHHPTLIDTQTKEPRELSVADAYNYNINSSVDVNMPLLIRLTGLEESDIIDQLGNKIYLDAKDQAYQFSHTFLSGDIWEKIDYTSAAITEAKLSSNTDLAETLNVSLAALTEIKPKLVPFEDIGINLGSRWVPVEIYEKFANKIFEQEEVKILYLEGSDNYIVDNAEKNSLVLQTFKAETHNRNYNGVQMLEFALVDSFPQATITEKLGDKTYTYIDEVGVRNLKLGRETLQNHFQQFLVDLQPEEKSALANKFNYVYNRHVKAVNDGTNLNFADLSHYEARPKQKEAVAHLITGLGGVIDYPVGEGKTLIMSMAAHEMKKLGIIKKPMIIAMKANYAAIAHEHKLAYPNDKVLFPAATDFSKDNLERFLHKMCYNDWDCIIMSHEQFKKIPQNSDKILELLNVEINALEKDFIYLNDKSDSPASKQAAKGLQKRMKSLEIKMLVEQDRIEKNTNQNVVDFKKIGIDHLFVDESHNFKNLAYSTRHYAVSGLGNAEGSQKAANMLVAVRTLQDRKGSDRNVTFCTASTIKNSLTELYTLFKYMSPKMLQERYCPSFDTWASNFAVKSTEFEFSVTGELKPKERFRGYFNIPELVAMYNDITCYMNPKDSKLDKPVKTEINHLLDPTIQQIGYMKKLAKFAESGDPAILNITHLTEKNCRKAKMALACSYGKMMTLDMRNISSSLYHDEHNNKLSSAANQIASIYNKTAALGATQFVFSDTGTPKPGFNCYDELKRKLIADHNIPSDQIRYIHEAKTEAQRVKLITAFRNGEIKIFFGSTQKLGTGVNAQDRVVALHHLDFPWTPEDMSQREGRALRFGNWLAKQHFNNSVEIHTYATKRTIDVFKVQTLKNKHEFISQIKNSDATMRSIEEPDTSEDAQMSYAEFVGLLSGNTDMMEKTKIDLKISELEKDRNTFHKKQLSNKASIAGSHHDLGIQQKNLDKILIDKTAISKFDDRDFSIVFLGKTYTDKKAFALELHNNFFKVSDTSASGFKQMISLSVKTNSANLGSYKGFTILLKEQEQLDIKLNQVFNLYLAGPSGLLYSTEEKYPNPNIEVTGRYFDLSLQKLDRMAERLPLSIQKLNKDIAMLETQKNIEWPKKDQLAELEVKRATIMERIKNTAVDKEKTIMEIMANPKKLTDAIQSIIDGQGNIFSHLHDLIPDSAINLQLDTENPDSISKVYNDNKHDESFKEFKKQFENIIINNYELPQSIDFDNDIDNEQEYPDFDDIDPDGTDPVLAEHNIEYYTNGQEPNQSSQNILTSLNNTTMDNELFYSVKADSEESKELLQKMQAAKDSFNYTDHYDGKLIASQREQTSIGELHFMFADIAGVPSETLSSDIVRTVFAMREVGRSEIDFDFDKITMTAKLERGLDGSIFVPSSIYKDKESDLWVSSNLGQPGLFIKPEAAAKLFRGDAMLIPNFKFKDQEPKDTWVQMAKQYARQTEIVDGKTKYSLSVVDPTVKLRFISTDRFKMSEQLGNNPISAENLEKLRKGEQVLHTAINANGQSYQCKLKANPAESKLDFEKINFAPSVEQKRERSESISSVIKKDIPLHEFLNFTFGYPVVRSGDTFKVKTDTPAGEIIVQRDKKYNTGNWIYHNNNAGESGNIYTFLSKEKGYGDTNQPEVMERIKSDVAKFDSMVLSLGGSEYNFVNSDAASLKSFKGLPNLTVFPSVSTQYLNSRGITDEVIHSLKYSDSISTKPFVSSEGKISSLNTAFPIRNELQEIVDVSQKNIGFSGNTENGNRNAGMWHSKIDTELIGTYNKVIIGEGAMDIISYNILNQIEPHNTVDFSSEGRLVTSQLAPLMEFISVNPGTEVVLVNDKDYAGFGFDATIIANLANAENANQAKSLGATEARENVVLDLCYSKSKNLMDSHLTMTMSHKEPNGKFSEFDISALQYISWKLKELPELNAPDTPTYNTVKNSYEYTFEFKRLATEEQRGFPVHQKVNDVLVSFHKQNTERVEQPLVNSIKVDKSIGKDWNQDLMQTKGLDKSNLWANKNVFKGMNMGQAKSFLESNKEHQKEQGKGTGVGMPQ